MASSLSWRVFVMAVVVILLAVESQATSKCVPELGCFYSSPGMIMLPKDPAEIKTAFHLYSRFQRHKEVAVNATGVGDGGVTAWRKGMAIAGWRADKVIKVIIHGYMNDAHKEWVVQMKEEFLNKEDVYVMAVSWPGGSRSLLHQAVADGVLVGRQLAIFLDFVAKERHVPYSDMHVVGHSIGAHIAGTAGHRVHGSLGRITGLDPAEPFYVDMGLEDRLYRDDATFVDVIHSDAEQFNGIQGYGWAAALGDVDFYPNGGYDQPGCSDSLLDGIFGFIGHNKDGSLACSHARSHHYFIESINPNSSCRFTARPCPSWEVYRTGNCTKCPAGGCPVMGDDVSHKARGSFYLATAMTEPYCGYEYRVEIDLTEHHGEDSRGRVYLTLMGDHNSTETEFSRDDVQYGKRVKELQVIAVHARVGHVTGVKVRFHHGQGHSAVKDKTLHLHEVIVTDPQSGDRYEFCTQDVHLSSDRPSTFLKSGLC